MVRKVEGTKELLNETVIAISNVLKKKYGSYWNFEIDVDQDADPLKNFELRVKVYKR